MIDEIDEELAKINSHFEFANGIFSALDDRMKVDVDRSRYPYSHRAVYHGVKKLDMILDSVLSQLTEEKYYVNCILIRAIMNIF